MKIGIDTLGENPKSPSSAINLLIELLKSCSKEKDNEFIVFVSNQNKFIFEKYNAKNITFVNCFFSNENIFLRILAQQILIPFFLFLYKCDGIYCPINSAPLLTSKPIFLKINTLHHIDLPKEFPVGFLRKLYRSFMFGQSAKKAKIIIANTQYLKDRLVNHYNFENSKIKISHEAYSEGFGVFSKDFSKKYVEKKYKINYDFIIYPSNMYNYKNHLNSLKGYIRFLEETNSKLFLIFLGRDEHNIKNPLIDLATRSKKLDMVKFIDFVPIEDAIHLINASSILYYPSRMETFGKPIIEGMISKIPVVGSKIPPIEELSYDKRLLFNVDNYDEMSKKLKLALNVDKTFLELSYRKAKDFTYDNHNKKIFEIINLYLNSNN
tara:strand:- start:2271 stop:3410 length:1140 start_codon:yes stop_codon:yes gene_type:complete